MSTNLKTTTTFSLRKSVINPDALVKTAKTQGFDSLAITEKGNISSAVKIYQKCKAAGIKPILGCDLYIRGPKGLSNLTVLCKNLLAWKDLLKIIRLSNSKDNYHLDKEIPTISLEDLANNNSGNFIAYAGSINSILGETISDNFKEFLNSTTYESAKSLVSPNWKENFDSLTNDLRDKFGKDNFFLELQIVDTATVPAAQILNKIIEDGAKRLGVSLIGTCKSQYLKPEDVDDLRLLTCIDKKAKLSDIEGILKRSDDTEFDTVFRNNAAHLFSTEQYSELYNKETLENNDKVASLCAEFNIINNPKIPKFVCPEGKQDYEYLADLCEGYWSKVPIGADSQYRERLNHEFKVLNEVGLSSYFLIVHDIVKYAQSNAWMVEARGSAGGSLVSYLLGISTSDPIQYNLIFERFYNSGRNTPGKISLPDIDLDVPQRHREKIINYLRDKYGRAKTANIATFSSLKGAGALKEVLRIKNVCSADEANQITKLVISEHKISDELEELRKEGEPASILGWTLEHIRDINQYAFYDDNGEIQGDYAAHFAQAIRLEGCKKSMGKHAAGLVVSFDDIMDFCPLVHDKSGEELLCGWEMGDAEAAGVMKLDILSQAVLDDIMSTIDMVNYGDFIRK